MKKIFFELVIVFLVVASLGGFYTLKSNHEIGRKKVAQIVVSSHLDHLITKYVALDLANVMYHTNKQTPEILEIRSFQARQAIDLLDNMRGYLVVFEDFPIEKFDKGLSDLKEDFDKGNPYLAVENLAKFTRFITAEIRRSS